MSSEQVIVCGGLDLPKRVGPGANLVSLNLWGGEGEEHIDLGIQDLPSQLLQTVPPEFQDLVEVAGYVCAADQATGRRFITRDIYGQRVQRKFEFHVPVRVPEVWDRPETKRSLCDALEFLTGDLYEFALYRARNGPEFERYFGLKDGVGPSCAIQEVVMYSGGLDSLCGAVEECVVRKRQIVLVHHWSTSKAKVRNRELAALLAAAARGVPPVHMHLRIPGQLAHDHTWGTRGFLYSSLGAMVSAMLGLKSVRFYEGAIASLSLPACEHLVGARGRQTTHPQVLQSLGALFSLLAAEPIEVENPFVWETKGEIIRRIADAGCGKLIGHSTTCRDLWTSSIERSHCGTCPECIARRLGVVAAGAEAYESPALYRTDFLTKPKPTEGEKTAVRVCLERLDQAERIEDSAHFVYELPEVGRPFLHLDENPASAGDRAFESYKKQMGEAEQVLMELLRRNLPEIVAGTLPGDCLLQLVYEWAVRAGKLAVEKPTVGKLANTYGAVTSEAPAADTILSCGRLRYSSGFEDVWLGNNHYDLRKRKKGRLCIQYLVEKEAFSATTARHLIDEIDPYVREHGDYQPSNGIRIDYYFKDPTGKLTQLRKELILAAGKNGKYFLKTE